LKFKLAPVNLQEAYNQTNEQESQKETQVTGAALLHVND
jgi:hypothetical protein